METRNLIVGLLCVTFWVVSHAAGGQAGPSHIDMVVEEYVAAPDQCEVAVAVARMFIPNEEGIKAPTKELYLILYRKGYPIIEDSVDGHHLEIQFLNGELSGVVALFYFSGGNQYLLRLYKLNEDRLIPFRSQPIGSNMRAILIHGNTVEVSNQISDGGDVRIVTDSFRIKSDECIEMKRAEQ